jgi:hypothetical protein
MIQVCPGWAGQRVGLGPWPQAQRVVGSRCRCCPGLVFGMELLTAHRTYLLVWTSAWERGPGMGAEQHVAAAQQAESQADRNMWMSAIAVVLASRCVMGGPLLPVALPLHGWAVVQGCANDAQQRRPRGAHALGSLGQHHVTVSVGRRALPRVDGRVSRCCCPGPLGAGSPTWLKKASTRTQMTPAPKPRRVAGKSTTERHEQRPRPTRPPSTLSCSLSL